MQVKIAQNNKMPARYNELLSIVFSLIMSHYPNMVHVFFKLSFTVQGSE
jgi:hypothetical protein